MRALLFVLFAFVAAGCGGETDTDGSGGAGGGGAGSGGAAGSAGSGGATGGAAGAPDGGWPECSAPGFAVCGKACPEGRPGCSVCFPPPAPDKFGVCGESLLKGEVPGKPSDGRVLATRNATLTSATFSLTSVAFAGGVFLAEHGQGDRVAYADRGLFTGAPLPEPTTCPSLVAGKVCGGLCGGCPLGQRCTGRSPLHPHGICVPDEPAECRHPVVSGWTCKSADACFVFTVEAERQGLANFNGFCLPKAECEAYRTLPGGGECH